MRLPPHPIPPRRPKMAMNRIARVRVRIGCYLNSRTSQKSKGKSQKSKVEVPGPGPPTVPLAALPPLRADLTCEG